jgi:hypothetical protein
MRERFFQYLAIICCAVLLSACVTTSQKTSRIKAPIPPLSDVSTANIAALSNIETASGNPSRVLELPSAERQTRQCSFSSFHRKNTIGYELDDRRQIGFRVSPDIDVFDLSETQVKVGLNFTMALGGSANKRPKCTYGSGYYGLLPYAINSDIDVSGLTDMDRIKSYAQERIEAREQRQVEREKRAGLGL